MIIGTTYMVQVPWRSSRRRLEECAAIVAGTMHSQVMPRDAALDCLRPSFVARKER